MSPTSYQLLTVTGSGLITPACKVWYWYGNIGYSYPLLDMEPTRVSRECILVTSTVCITADNEQHYVTVKVENYADIYTDAQISSFIEHNIKEEMTTYEKLEKLCQYVAGFDYSARYSSAKGMILSGSGDCWASTDMLMIMCKKIGIECIARNGNRDPGSGSGHMNALAIIEDGLYYELEAGYNGTAPRSWSITERHSLFSYSRTNDGIKVYQYDGDLSETKSLTVPQTIDGKTVVEIGEKFLELESAVEEVVLPPTV